jgi:hypothetical protein
MVSGDPGHEELRMIRWQGSEYEFDIDKAGTAELREIKRKYKLSLRKLLEGLEEMDVDAVTCVYWLVMRSDGKHDDLVLGDDLEFPVVEFMAAWADDQQEAEPDPTQDGSLPDTATPQLNGSSTRTSAKSATSTSPASPASTASSRGTSTG